MNYKEIIYKTFTFNVIAMKIQEVWNMLVTGRNFPDIDCWWLRHNEASNVLVMNNRGKHVYLNIGLKVYCLSGLSFSTVLPKLRSDCALEFNLSELPQWNEKPMHDNVAAIELVLNNQTFCYKIMGGRLIATTHKLEKVVQSFPDRQGA